MGHAGLSSLAAFGTVLGGCGFISDWMDEVPSVSVGDAARNVHRIMFADIVDQNNKRVPDHRADQRLTEHESDNLWMKLRAQGGRQAFIEDYVDLLNDADDEKLNYCLAHATSPHTVNSCRLPTTQDRDRARSYVEMELHHLNAIVQEKISRRLNTDVIITKDAAKKR